MKLQSKKKKKRDTTSDCSINFLYYLGGAVGASSILLIRPTTCNELQLPKGVVIAVLVNLQEVNLQRTAIAIAACFEKTQL